MGEGELEMLKYALIGCCLISLSSYAKDKKKRKPSQEQGSQQVLPLDPTAESVLRSSPYGPFVREDGQNEMEFRQKVLSFSKKIERFLPKDVDKYYFVYDCLFMMEQGIKLKYPKISTQQINTICLPIQKEFSNQ